MITEDQLKELGFNIIEKDIWTGLPIWVKGEYFKFGETTMTYYPTKNWIVYRDGEFCNVKKIVKDLNYLKQFIKILWTDERINN